MEGVWKASGDYLEGVWGVSWSCLEAVFVDVCEGVRELSGECLAVPALCRGLLCGFLMGCLRDVFRRCLGVFLEIVFGVSEG